MHGKERVLKYFKSVKKHFPDKPVSAMSIAICTRMQVNTCIKWIHLLRKEGHDIRSHRAPGKSYYLYSYHGGPDE